MIGPGEIHDKLDRLLGRKTTTRRMADDYEAAKARHERESARAEQQVRERYPLPDLVCDVCNEAKPTTRELPQREMYVCLDCDPRTPGEGFPAFLSDAIEGEWTTQIPMDCPFDRECNGDFTKLGSDGAGTAWRCNRCEQALTLYAPVPWRSGGGE